MWRWYVEVVFLVLVCFAAGAAVAALVMARLLPAASVDEPAPAAPAAPATGSGS